MKASLKTGQDPNAKKGLILNFFLVLFTLITTASIIREKFFKAEAQIKAKYNKAIVAWKALDTLKISQFWSLRNIGEKLGSLTSMAAALKPRGRNGPVINLDIITHENNGEARPFTDLTLQPNGLPVEGTFTFGTPLDDEQFKSLTPGAYDLSVSMTKNDEQSPFLVQHFLILLDASTLSRLKGVKRLFHRKKKFEATVFDHVEIQIL